MSERTKNFRNQSKENPYDVYLDLSSFDISFFREKDNTDYCIDILPYLVETDNHPNRKKGEETYKLDIFVHKRIKEGVSSSFLCMSKTFGQDCVCCAELAKLNAEKVDWEEIKHLKTVRRIIYFIKESGQYYIYDTSYALFEQEWLKTVEKKERKGESLFPIYTDCKDDCSLEFTTTEKKGIGRYSTFELVPIKDYNEDYKKHIFSLEKALVIPDQEKIKQILYGYETGDIEEENLDDYQEEDNKTDKRDLHTKEEKEAYYDKIAEDQEKETPRRRRRKREEKVNTCPNGLTFGLDWDSDTLCDECLKNSRNIFDACGKEADKLEGN